MTKVGYGDKDAIAKVLAKHASDDDSQVRLAVAKNPKTTAETLTKLASDEDERVRWEVAHNPKTLARILTSQN